MLLGIIKGTVNIHVTVKCCNVLIKSSLEGGVEWSTGATESHAMLCDVLMFAFTIDRRTCNA
jgi:hypothetical protein